MNRIRIYYLDEKGRRQHYDFICCYVDFMDSKKIAIVHGGDFDKYVIQHAYRVRVCHPKEERLKLCENE